MVTQILQVIKPFLYLKPMVTWGTTILRHLQVRRSSRWGRTNKTHQCSMPRSPAWSTVFPWMLRALEWSRPARHGYRPPQECWAWFRAYEPTTTTKIRTSEPSNIRGSPNKGHLTNIMLHKTKTYKKCVGVPKLVNTVLPGSFLIMLYNVLHHFQVFNYVLCCCFRGVAIHYDTQL